MRVCSRIDHRHLNHFKRKRQNKKNQQIVVPIVNDLLGMLVRVLPAVSTTTALFNVSVNNPSAACAPVTTTVYTLADTVLADSTEMLLLAAVNSNADSEKPDTSSENVNVTVIDDEDVVFGLVDESASVGAV